MERSLPSPPGVKIDDGDPIKQVRLIAHGRGRPEKFAVVASYPSNVPEYDVYSVLDTKKPITGDFNGIGFVTSVSQDITAGVNVGIATIKSTIAACRPEKVIYRNLHWNHWRVAKVEYIETGDDRSFHLLE